jgi:hypothetical protein
MRNTTLSFMKETKPFDYKPLFSLNDREKELLVEVIPFLVVISAILRLFSSNNNSDSFIEYSSDFILIGLILTSFIFALFLFYGLFKRKKYGWILMFFFQGILLIYDLSVGNIITGILTGLIGGWMLMQVRKKYL